MELELDIIQKAQTCEKRRRNAILMLTYHKLGLRDIILRCSACMTEFFLFKRTNFLSEKNKLSTYPSSL